MSEHGSSADFEGKNWTRARINFKEKHESNEMLRLFLGSTTNAHDVKSIGGILENIDALMNLGDVAIKSAPESVGLAWMGVRSCLRAVQGDWATFQLFSGACADIIGILISCRVYGKMYGSEDGPKGFEELHEKVVDFIPQIYSDILDFSYAVYKYTQKRAIIRIGTQIFKDVKGVFESQITGIRESDVKMRDFAKIASERMMIYLQTQSIKGQDDVKMELVSLRETLNASLSSNEAIVRHLFEELEETRKDSRRKTPYEKAQDEYEENMEHLNRSKIQYEILQENLDVLREPQTCRWIFELEEYKNWDTSSQSSMLWVSGEGGYGKSILMSTVIERLRFQHTDDSKAVIQYFFCKVGSKETQSTDQIFKSIVAQLYERCLAFPEQLDRANSAIKKGLGKVQKTDPVKFNLEVALAGLLQAMACDVYLVIDALDECLDRQEEQLLLKLRRVIRTSKSRTRIMICSRPKADIAIDLSGIPNIKCEGNNTQDIERNVITQMRGFPGWTASERLYAVHQIVERSGGQFRFVKVALDILRKPLVRPFEPTIDKLPNGLEGSYITSWNTTDPDYRELLKTALTWTIFADGVATVPIIMDAYSRTFSAEAGIGEEEEGEEENESLTEPGEMDLHEKQIRIAGGQFLEVSNTRHVTLRHLTVKDFFVAKSDNSSSASDQEENTKSKAKQDSLDQTKVTSGAPWTISEKRGQLDILKVILQNLTSPTFQKKYLLPYAQGGVFLQHGWLEPSDDEEDEQDEDEEGNENQDRGESESRTDGKDEVEKQLMPRDRNKEEQHAKMAEAAKRDNESEQDEKEIEETEQEDKGSVRVRKVRRRDGFGQFLVEDGHENSDNTVDASIDGIDSHSRHEDPDGIPNLIFSNEPDFDSRKLVGYGSSSSEGESDEESDERSDEEVPSGLGFMAQKQYRYELTHWVYHLHQAQALWSTHDQETNAEWIDIWNKLLVFMCQQRSAFKAWLRLLCYHDRSIRYLQICRANPLHVAAFLGLSSFVKALMTRGYAINEPCLDVSRFGLGLNGYFAPLDFAVCSNSVDVETVKLLVDYGGDVNCKNRALGRYHDFSVTPFHKAVLRQPIKDLVEHLLAHGADPSARDGDNQTAVHYFSYNGRDPDALLLLLKAQPDLDLLNSPTSYDRQTPLHLLVARKNDLPLDLLGAYLKAGADPNVDDRESMRPLRMLSMYGNAPAVKLLIEHGAEVDDVDDYGQTALHVAARSGNAETLKILLEKGSRLNLPDGDGRTPLFLACRANNEGTATYLFEQLAGQPENEVNKPDKMGSTPLREAASGGNVRLIKLLLSKATSLASINEGDTTYQQNALHKAAIKGRYTALEVLCEQGGNLSLEDNNGLTPFQLCIRFWINKQQESVPLEETLCFLVKQGAPPSSELSSLMFTAAAKGSIKVMESLLDFGVDPKSEDAHGWTPAMMAQYHGQQGIVDLLSKHRKPGGKRPSGWADLGQRIAISADRLAVRPIAPSFFAKTVISDHPIPPTATKYYFEVEIAYDWTATRNLKIHERLAIGATTYPCILNAAGLTILLDVEAKEYPFKRSYGWDPIRNILRNFRTGSTFGPNDVQREEGDVIGCGIDYAKKILFFTNNHKRLASKYEFSNISGRLYPAVSIEGRYIAKANFGSRPFRWKGWKAWSTSL